jgi:tight adherence protein C
LLRVAEFFGAGAVFFLFTAIIQALDHDRLEALRQGYERPKIRSGSLLAAVRKLGVKVSQAPVARDLLLADGIERQLHLAGYSLSAQEWFGVWMLSLGFSVFLGLSLWGSGRLPLFLACVFPILGFTIPRAILSAKSGRVLLETGIEFIGFTEKFSLMVGGAGMSIIDGFKACAADTFLGREIDVLVEDFQNGLPLENALDAFAGKIGLPEADTFVRAIKGALRYGPGRLPEVLGNLVDDMRRARESKVEMIARTMENKVILPVVGTVMPVIFLLIIGPFAVIVMRMLMG